MRNRDKTRNGPGERMERERSNRRKAIIAILFVAGMGSGAYVGHNIGSEDWNFTAPWPPAAALILAGIYLAAMIFGSIALCRHIDEVERQVQYKAAAFAGGLYVTVYPVWFLLWKGGFVPEPMHTIVFLLFWLGIAISTLYYRFR